jgi:hypothetical protein
VSFLFTALCSPSKRILGGTLCSSHPVFFITKRIRFFLQNTSSLVIIDLIFAYPLDVPVPQTLPCNVAPIPAPINIPAPVTNMLASLRKRPARVPGFVGANAAYLVPDHVRKKFAEGWQSHIPLTFLTDKGCLAKDKHSSSHTQEILTIDETTGAIQTSSKPLVDEGELDLSFDEWHQAWRRLLDLIRMYIPQEFLLWEIHYSFILNKENRAELWPLYLAYDVEIRKRSIIEPIDPSQFSIGVWNDLETRYTAKKVLAIVQAGLKNSNQGTTTRNTPDKNKPRNSSFRKNQSSSASDSSKTGRCMFCGDRARTHLSRNCTACNNVDGTPCHLHRVEPSGPGSSSRIAHSGKRYCYAWNGLSGCESGATCTRGEHLCTLCGSSSHAAQLCNVVA